MLKAESRIGTVKHSGKKIFEFLCDFRNYEKLIPEGKINNWEAEEDSCRFSVDGLGEAGIRVVEKKPFQLIKLTGDGPYSIDFFMWVQIKEAGENDSRVKLTLQAEMNAMMSSMAKGPVKQFLDIMLDYLEKMDYE
ncbi:MAG TPA: SRPBCC family protein [Bacteroidetes bacterium]|nr:SRPBCC family protein [Bacteroidota bacterium]